MLPIPFSQCPFCHSSSINKAFSIKDYSISQETFELFKCQTCTLLFTQNPPLESNIGRYYESNQYISHSDTTKGVIAKTYHWIRTFMLTKKRMIIDPLCQIKKVIDIGSGTGYFLNEMKSHGFEVLGIEKNKSARDFSIEHFKIDVRDPETLLSGTLMNTFDVATMWHVLEHIYAPKLYLTAIRNALTQNGYLIIAVPNYQSYDATHYKEHWAAYDVPRHLWHFDYKTIQQLVHPIGFKLMDIKRMPFDSYYVAMLSESFNKKAWSIVKALLIGFISNLISRFNPKKTSSILYIFQKINVTNNE